jgi:hypothetical protein
VSMREAGEVRAVSAGARHSIASARAPATLRALPQRVGPFWAWCDLHDFAALAGRGETVAMYLSDLARTAKPPPSAAASSISQAHYAAGHAAPTVEAAVRSTPGPRLKGPYRRWRRPR